MSAESYQNIPESSGVNNQDEHDTSQIDPTVTQNESVYEQILPPNNELLLKKKKITGSTWYNFKVFFILCMITALVVSIFGMIFSNDRDEDTGVTIFFTLLAIAVLAFWLWKIVTGSNTPKFTDTLKTIGIWVGLFLGITVVMGLILKFVSK